MNGETKKYRTQLADSFIHVLEEKQLDWKKECNGNTPAPVNVLTKAKYRGINRLNLMMLGMERKYEDPRWATFKQIEKMGLRLKNAKGQGVKVEYWFPWDSKERHAVSWEEFNLNPKPEYVLRSQYSTVFNGSLIEGLPEISQKERRNTVTDRMITDISKSMKVEIVNTEDDRAFYRPAEDKIYLPKPELFYSDYAYNSVALHELSHATGAPGRLARNQKGIFGTQAYAYEELVAEISSAFFGGRARHGTG